MSLAASNTGEKAASTGVADDAALVERFRGGDPSALGPLIEKYQDRVFNTCRRLCGRPDDAADLTQDVFVRVFETLGSFAGRSAFYTWVFRIAVNLAISHRRRAGPRRTISLDAARRDADDERGGAPGDWLASDGSRPDDAIAEREQESLAAMALAELEDEARAVIVLRDVEAFDYEQIGEILDVPVGTVKSRLHRARLALREKLATRTAAMD